uniref:Uncharacterized protein n=1 Tax=Malurus cyaneus samueli TaxID=2593467 RepID=A0A8C5THT8_9PASS
SRMWHKQAMGIFLIKTRHHSGCDNPCPLCFQRLRSGVVRDLERQNQKKENIRLLEEQIALTKQLMEERDKALMEKRSQQS